MWKIINYLTFLLIIVIVFQNYSIIINEYDTLDSNIRIVQISDLHTRSFGTENTELIKKIEKLQPNVITITGDIIDGSNIDLIYITHLVKHLSKIAPVLYVIGNNDMWTGKIDKIIEAVELGGGVFLNNDYITIGDVNFFGHNPYYNINDLDENLDKFLSSSNELVFLTHQPENTIAYSKYDIDLFLSGHTHGGQVRVPFIGALVVPDQGIFPKYDKGLYMMDNSLLIVSSGLGNSIIPFRIFNPPEIVIVT